jgi:tetratricopeptide (TPR) repeat protein
LRHEAKGRFQEAKADYESAIGINPQYANAYNNRGNMRLREEDPEGAVRDYTEAIRLNPNFHEAYCNRGIARQKLGRCDEAREDYLQAQSLDSGYSDASRRLQLLDGIDPGHLPGQRC